MVLTSRSVALGSAIAAALTAPVQAAPLKYNPSTPIDTSVPLTASHPAYGGKLNDDCTKSVIPEDTNQAKAEAMVVTGSIYRKLPNMEDASNTDVVYHGNRLQHFEREVHACFCSVVAVGEQLLANLPEQYQQRVQSWGA
ncbi:hypothetical protein ON010_g4702 [Phytophthora cinnamomi]|nr:hypothetical protein ON010_g4702 [Phytophthora cinnamomi]